MKPLALTPEARKAIRALKKAIVHTRHRLKRLLPAIGK
jgi:hypothetical protein